MPPERCFGWCSAKSARPIRRRYRSTIAARSPALARLADAGWIGRDEAGALSASYTLLRTIEHRVQMVDDRQTHRLPEGEALDRLARTLQQAGGAMTVGQLLDRSGGATPPHRRALAWLLKFGVVSIGPAG